MRSYIYLLLVAVMLPSVVAAQNLSPEKVRDYTRTWLERKIKKAEAFRNAPQQYRPTPSAYPPNKSIQEGNVSQNTTVESEIAAAINPQDPNKIVVCALRTTDSQLVDELAFPIYYSTDFGETWSVSDFKPEEILPTGTLVASAGGGDPILAYDADGLLHLSWLRVSLQIVPTGIQFLMYHAVSADDGVTWTVDDEPVATGSATISLEGKVVDKEWMVADNNPASPHYGNLYLVYAELNAISQDSVLYQILSHTWTAESGWSEATVAVSSDDLPFCQFVHPTITPNGDLHLTLAGASNEDNYAGIYHTVSGDGGVGFATPNLISYFNLSCFLNEPGSEPCINGVLAERSYPAPAVYSHPVSGELYCTWHGDGFQEAVTEGVDVYFSRSVDNGLSWTTPTVVNGDDDPAVDNFMATGAVDGEGNFFLTWYDQRNDDTADTTSVVTDYYWARFDPESGTFTNEGPVSALSTDFKTVGAFNAGFGVGEYNTTLTANGVLLPIWSDGRTNDGSLEIFMAKIDDGIATSVHSLRNQSFQLDVYPNPVRENGQLRIIVEKSLDDPRAEILDVNGKWLTGLALPERLATGEHQIALPLGALPAGSYFLRFGTEAEGSVVKRVVVR